MHRAKSSTGDETCFVGISWLTMSSKNKPCRAHHLSLPLFVFHDALATPYQQKHGKRTLTFAVELVEVNQGGTNHLQQPDAMTIAAVFRVVTACERQNY